MKCQYLIFYEKKKQNKKKTRLSSATNFALMVKSMRLVQLPYIL